MTSLPNIITWDNGRQLQSFTKDNVTTSYNYDSNGMRVRKNASDGHTQYYYDSNNNLIALCYTPTTGAKKVVNFFYDSEGSPVAFQVNGSQKYYYIKNLQGDIDKIINVDGEVLVTYTYDAWGNILDVTDNSTNNLSTLNPFRYRGYAYDSESGFYYLQSRYYDPQTGRFLNADETAYLGATNTALSCNLFAYCENEPVNHIDPSGNFAISKSGILSFIAGSAGQIIAIVGTVCGLRKWVFLATLCIVLVQLSLALHSYMKSSKNKTAKAYLVISVVGAIVTVISSAIGRCLYVRKIESALCNLVCWGFGWQLGNFGAVSSLATSFKKKSRK